MPDIYEETRPYDQPVQDLIEEDSSLGSFIGSNIVKIIIGLVVVAVLIGGVVIALNQRFIKVLPQKKESETKIAATPSPQASLTKIYKDSSYGFSFKFPSDWEAFKRTGDNTSFQIALRPLTSSDIPIAINAQPNSSLTVDDVVNTYYGASYPREKITIGSNDYLFVNNFSSSYKSYFLINKGVIFEISATTASDKYSKEFDSIIASLSF